MDWLEHLDLSNFLLFVLVLCRVSGLVMTAPIYGTNDVPVQVRGFLAIALALLLTPTQATTAIEHPGSMPNFLVLLGSELVIGVCLGMGIMILFSGIQLAGQLIGRISGMMLADVFDPTVGESVPQFARLLFLVAMAVFVTIGGHRIVMAALLDTFVEIPAGSGVIPISIVDAFERLLTLSFSLGIRAAAPVVTAVLLSTLVMGLISRTLPQMNILMVGFGMNSMLTYGTLALSLGAAVWVFQDQVEPALAILFQALFVSPRAEWLG